MKVDINGSYEFIEYMRKYEITSKFTDEALHAMYDYIEELYHFNDDYYTMDAIELSSHYNEYDSIDDYIIEYYTVEEVNALYFYRKLNDKVIYERTPKELIDEVRNETVVIDIPNTSRVIVSKY